MFEISDFPKKRHGKDLGFFSKRSGTALLLTAACIRPRQDSNALSGTDNIRDVIFPKLQNASCLMTEALRGG